MKGSLVEEIMFSFCLPFVTYSNGVKITKFVNLACRLPMSALRLNSTEVAVEASWLFSSCSTSSSSFSSSPSRNKKINLLSYSYSLTLAFFSSSKYLVYKEVTRNTQNLCRLCYNPTIMIRSFHIIPAKKCQME